ncbi:hypothetical protein ACJRO7_025194 [Eucalyptus globulus]|uniref:Uncharacterized protein n=1 Tax=Eucalyptus globulus TaxID=34317 RepID=A0ABD3KKB2_EUCGL
MELCWALGARTRCRLAWFTTNLKHIKKQLPQRIEQLQNHDFGIHSLPLVPYFKHSELIHVFSFSICAIFAQVVDFPFICLAFQVHSIEQTTVFLNLAIFSGFTLCAEINQKTGTLLEVSGCSCSFCFWSRTYACFISIPMIMLGLEGRYHWQLQLVALVSFLSALAATCFPTSFLASLVLAIFVTFQGCWFFLCVPECVPKVWTALSAHTSGELVHGAIICGSGNADCRVRALANLQFSWILAGILFLTGSLCMKLASIYTERGQHTEYKRLLGKGAELPLRGMSS